MASFDKSIPPGGEGKITLRVRTKGYQGAKQWGATVYTNDPKWKTVILTVKAFVKVPIYLSSPSAYLYGRPGQSVIYAVEVRAQLDRSLTLKPMEFNLDGKVTYTLEEVEKGRRFEILFRNIPGPAETYRGFLELKTNYPENPASKIRIWGRFREKGS